MPTQVPSIWDYIAGAGTKGIETYQDAQDKLRRQQMEQAGILSQLFGQGAINNTDLMPGLAKIGIQANVQPNAPQIKRESGLQGLETQNAVEAEKLKGQTMYDPVLKTAGENYIDMALVPYGGKVPENWQSVVDRAWGLYVSANQKEGLPIKPEHRAFFVSRIFERKQDQSKLDLDAARAAHEGRAAEASMLNARANMTSAQRQLNMNDPAVKAYDALQRTYNTQMTQLNRILGDPYAAVALGDPSTPQYKEYAALKEKIAATENALYSTVQGVKGYTPPPQPKPVTAPQTMLSQYQRDGIVERVLSRNVTLAQVARDADNGRMSRADFDAIKAAVIANPRSKGTGGKK